MFGALAYAEFGRNVSATGGHYVIVFGWTFMLAVIEGSMTGWQ